MRAMQAHLENGLSAAEAARLASAGQAPRAPPSRVMPSHAGSRSCARRSTQWTPTRRTPSSTACSPPSHSRPSYRGVLLPYLHELGERWRSGEASIAQEHFASNLLRARLLALARGWERGEGRTALLACAPGEQHDLPLITFGLALRGRGWRIVFLGTDTPAASIADTAEHLRPALTVVSSVTPRGFRREADTLTALAREHRLAIAGAGASEKLAESLGCSLLHGDPVAAASDI